MKADPLTATGQAHAPADLRQAAVEIRAWWHGELPLFKTIVLNTVLGSGVHVLWWMVEDGMAQPIYGRDAQILMAARIALTTGLMLMWGVTVFRLCMRRLEAGKRLTVTFVVFMTTLILIIQGMTGNVAASAQWLQVQRAESRKKWSPLEVYADAALGRIVARGRISEHSADEFERVVLANPQYQVVQIESQGGYVYDSHRMAHLIRARQLSTVSLEVCASACTELFVAGAKRFLGPGARFGFHRSGYPTMPRFASASPEDLRHAQFLRERGVAEDFIQRELNTPYFSIWRPSHDEMFAADFATHRWSERPAGW